MAAPSMLELPQPKQPAGASPDQISPRVRWTSPPMSTSKSTPHAPPPRGAISVIEGTVGSSAPLPKAADPPVTASAAGSAEPQVCIVEEARRRDSKKITTALQSTIAMTRQASFDSENSNDTIEDKPNVTSKEEDVNHLLENDMSGIFGPAKGPPGYRNSQSSVGGTGDNLEGVLASLQEDQQYHSESGGPIIGSRRDSFTGNPNLPKNSTSENVSEELLKCLFNATGSNLPFKQKHHALPRVVKQVFAVDKDAAVGSGFAHRHSGINGRNVFIHGATRSAIGISSWPRLYVFRAYVQKIITNSNWIALFLVLTVYALFGPDLVTHLGREEHEHGFLMFNTVVFFLFMLELVLLVCGNKNYVVSIPFVLDTIAFFSFLSETWMFQDNAFGDPEGDRVTRMARSSRMTRLTRVARVARVTRLVPRIMQMCGTQKTGLAKQVLLRRLWRMFKFMDTDDQNLLTWFDLKVVYLTIMQEVPAVDRRENWAEDLQLLSCAQDQHRVCLNFNDFQRTFLATSIGKYLLIYHLEDIQQEEGVWNLTQKLSDSTAIKVCVGILLVVIVMSLLGSDREDAFVAQGLAHLHNIARAEHRNTAGFDGDHICGQLALFKRLLLDDLTQKVLFILLDGRQYYREGAEVEHCSNTTVGRTISDPLSLAEDLSRELRLRTKDLDLSCIPADFPPSFENRQNCTGANLSMVYINSSAEVRAEAMWAIVMTTVVIALLLVFIYVFNLGITQFSQTLLQPLRSLVDDMMAMSSLELVHIDADSFQDQIIDGQRKKKKGGTVEEVQHLQNAFKTMRTSIRSWSKYVPPAVVQKLFSAGVEATIGVVKTHATVLFCDIDGFENACKHASAKEVIDLLTTVLDRIARVIDENRGTLLEYIESEVLAVFGTPNALKNHPYAAACSAIGIHRVIAELRPMQFADGLIFTVRCRVAIHTASILAGNVGSQRRMKYGLLGDGVNLTARFKGLNSKYNTRTIMSSSVAIDDTCMRKCAYRPVDLVAVKGKTEPTMVYNLLGMKKGDNDELPFEQASQKHRQAMECYHQRKFVEAKALFHEVRTMLEATGNRDQPSRQLMGRCTGYIKNPPPWDWDGVERLTKKVFEVVEVDTDEEEPDAVGVPSAEILRAPNINADGPSSVDTTADGADLLEASSRLEVTTERSASHRTTPQIEAFQVTPREEPLPKSTTTLTIRDLCPCPPKPQA